MIAWRRSTAPCHAAAVHFAAAVAPEHAAGDGVTPGKESSRRSPVAAPASFETGRLGGTR
jgi:hypothetical protein